MDDKRGYIFGLITISAVIGVTIYSIVEYKKLSKQNEEAIDIDQAKKYIEDYENQEIEERYDSGEIDGFREKMVEMGPEEYEHPREITEEDKILRHEPSSQEALDQFVAMNLAEWLPGSETYETLLYLYTFPFTPTTEGDGLMRERLIHDREEFFGEDSKWNSRVTYADVVLYFTREIVFNLDGSMNFWVEFLLENMDVNHLMSSQTIDTRLKDLNNHRFFNDITGGFGLFGLDADGLEGSFEIVDTKVTTGMSYDIQFNEFLKRTEI